MNLELSRDNFELFASKHYQKNKWATTDEYNADMSRFKYINRLIKRYYRDDDLKERLILNHMIVLGNVLGPAIAADMVMFNTDGHLKSIVKTFLVYLHYLPEDHYVGIALDSDIIDVLRKI